MKEEPLVNLLKKSDNPWGEDLAVNSSTSGSALGFEDSFTECSLEQPKDADTGTGAKAAYVPLDDSKEYLEKLQKKVDKFKSKDESAPWTQESRKMILDFLLTVKKDQDHWLLNRAVESWAASDDQEEEVDEVLNKGLVDPQGAAGKVMRKCAPVRVALARNELVNLLSADELAKRHEKHLEKEDQEGKKDGVEEEDTKNEGRIGNEVLPENKGAEAEEVIVEVSQEAKGTEKLTKELEN